MCKSDLSNTPIDGKDRLACPTPSCGYVHWDNPIPVVAAIVELDGNVVLTRSKGWPEKMFGLVAGFLEQGETPDDILPEAFAAIAETGSIVMCSSKESPVSLNFLPDHYMCVVHSNRVVNTMEDVWARVRSNGETLPRAINIITGPSRTADVEQIIQMGAHGPRRVHLLLRD